MKKIKCLLLPIFCILLFTGCDEVDNVIYPYPDSKDVIVTLEKYNELENGMTEEEVWDMIGGKCTMSSETGTEGEQFHSVIYGCNGKGKTGANALLTFVDGKLYNKIQVGINK